MGQVQRCGGCRDGCGVRAAASGADRRKRAAGMRQAAGKRASGHGRADADPTPRYWTTLNSIRRLRARPSAVRLSATGRSGPSPDTVTMSALTPRPTT